MCTSQSAAECFFPCVVLMEPSKWDSQPFLASKAETLEQCSHGGEVPGNEDRANRWRAEDPAAH